MRDLIVPTVLFIIAIIVISAIYENNVSECESKGAKFVSTHNVQGICVSPDGRIVP
jgi:hypothetical protein